MKKSFKVQHAAEVHTNGYFETVVALMVLGTAGWVATTIAWWASAL